MNWFRFSLLAFCLLLLSLPAFAQDTNTAEWGDLGVFVDYPNDWEADDSGENAALVLFGEDGIYIKFYEPGNDYDSALQAMEAISTNEEYEFEDIEDFVVMGVAGYSMAYANDDYAGFVVTFEFDSQVLVLEGFVVGDRISSREKDAILEVISSLHTNGENNPPLGGDTIESATDEDSTGEDIVEELIDLGIVSDGGDFLFEEEEVDEDSQDLSESYEGGKIAMGALISYERAEDDEEYRVCGFITQATTDDMSDDEGTLMITGLDSDSAFVTFELDIEDIEGSIFEAHDSGVDVEDQNHLIVVVQDDTLSAFVNGELVLEEYELDIAAGDDELFTGYLADLGCTMNNVWAYTFE